MSPTYSLGHHHITLKLTFCEIVIVIQPNDRRCVGLVELLRCKELAPVIYSRVLALLNITKGVGNVRVADVGFSVVIPSLEI